MPPTSTLPPQTFIPTRSWWKSSVIYQIYPISFFDSNHDGFGDLNGITSKLDYLKDLGVDVLWLSPIYKSPWADMGYDVADYCDIDPRYGTLDDFDRMLKGAHDRGIKIVMDLVVNHTSDEHEWFVKSRSSKDRSNTKRDWYIWRPPKYDESGQRKPPNNWRSHFQGSTWTYDSSTDEYYLHLYHEKQPDLNWENEDVRKAVYELMLFWVDRGCDGFRMDVINKISKVPGLPDAPITDPDQEYQSGYKFYVNGPRVHEFIKEMYREVLSKHDIMTVGETPLTHSVDDVAAYVLPQNNELNMVFHFELVDIDRKGKGSSPLIHEPYLLSEFKQVITKWQTFKRGEGFWNTVFVENHDQPRSVSRFADDSEKWRSLTAKLLAILQVSQTGTLYVYQGEEIGMKNFPRSWGIEEYKDISSINFYNSILEQRKKENPGTEIDMSDVMDNLAKKARDHGRTPMQWNNSPQGGFTTGTPWMRVNEDYSTWNAAAQEKNDSSVLAFWRNALNFRRGNEVLIYGDFVDLLPKDEQIYAYTRSLEGTGDFAPAGKTNALVLLNFTDKELEYDARKLGVKPAKYDAVLCNYDSYGDGDLRHEKAVKLRAWEGCVFMKRDEE